MRSILVVGEMAAFLIVVDDERLARSVADLIARAGHAVERARCGRSALDRAASGSYAAVLLDHCLDGQSDLNGPRFFGELRRRRSDLPVFLVTQEASDIVRAAALRAGIADVIVAPVTAEVVETRIVGVVMRTGAPRVTDPTFGSDLMILFDAARRLVRIGGDCIELTARQARLLNCMFTYAVERRAAPWRALAEACFANGEPPDPLLLEAEVSVLRERFGEHRWRLRKRGAHGVLLVTGAAESGTYRLDSRPPGSWPTAKASTG